MSLSVSFRHWRAVSTALTLLLATALSPAYGAENYALLVGVSDYPNLKPELSLAGPRNDVRLMSELLLSRGYKKENITLLSDQPAATLPTKQAISEGMSSLQKKVKRGDVVYLHFSGHGSQQPAAVDDLQEADGLDEIFLPRDVSNWNFEQGSVPNAITDDEIGQWVDALRDKGAFVWIVFDSCHSGTMTRSATRPEIKLRKVSPASLGIPPLEPRATSRGVASKPEQLIEVSDESGTGRGGVVAFFASQSDEETPEMSLPRGGAERHPYGLFTYTLAETLSRNPDISYQQLAQQVAGQYAALPWRRTQPLFSGTAMQQRVLAEGSLGSRHRATITKESATFSVGQLHGFSQGAVVELFDSAVAEKAFGTAAITESTMVTSSVSARALPAKSPKRLYAQLAKPAVNFHYRVGWLNETPSAHWARAAEALHKDNFLKRNMEWSEKGEAADIRLWATQQRLYFFTQDDQLPCALVAPQPCSDEPEQQVRYLEIKNPAGVDQYIKALQATLINGLTRMIRAQNLLRLASALGQLGNNLSLKLDVTTGDGAQQQHEAFSAPLSLHQGDKLRLEYKNVGTQAMDVSVLFIDSAFGIYQLYPEPGQPGRLFATEQASVEGEIETSTLGLEQFMVIATPADRNDPPSDYSFLQQEPLAYSQELETSRSRGVDHSLFAEAVGDQPATRGFGKKAKQQAQASAQLIRWQTVEGK